MKSILKNYVPFLYNFLRRLYHSTPIYKDRVQSLHDAQILTNKLHKAVQNKIMLEVFDNQFVVHNGPFKNMKYINESSGSAFLPKILGSYEEPIQEWIQEVIESKKYLRILDIGSAEGYYAVGLAIKMPKTQITAYDIDAEARINLVRLINANNVSNIEIKAECTHEELNTKCITNTLVICDIEGFEKFLLDPIKVSNLKYADIIIESHDCFVPNITEELINRFNMTHSIRINIDYPYRINDYKMPKAATEIQFKDIIDEKRPYFMKFIFLKSLYEKI